MLEVAAICFLKLKSLSNVTPILRTNICSCDAMTNDVRRKKRVSLLRCLNVPIMMKYVLLALSLN